MKKWHIVVIVAVTVIIIGGVTLDRWLHPFDLAAEIARARAAGIAVTPAEFHRVKPPAAKDAGPDWMELARLQTSGSPPSRAKALAWIHRATAKPSAYFPHVWTLEELFPYHAVMRNNVRLLSDESMSMAAQGHYVDAVRNQALGYRAARHAGEDPIYIGYLVGLAADRITTDGLVEILQRSGPRPEVTKAIRHALRANPLYERADMALQGEVLGMLSAANSLHSLADLLEMSGTPKSSVPELARLPIPSGMWRHFFTEPNQAAYLHYMFNLIEAARGPVMARDAAVQTVVDDVNRLPDGNPSYTLARLLIPVFGPPTGRPRTEIAARQVLLAATEVMDYRSRHGHWPDRLEQAGPEPPMDPFSGKPLFYQRVNGGFVVKSIGESGGKPIVFRFPRPTGVQR